MRRQRCDAIWLSLILVGAAFVSADAGDPGWLDPDGRPLPFATHEELENFLKTAEVVSSEDIGTGVTLPKKLLLEKGGVRAHAIFKDVDERTPGVSRVKGLTVTNWHDYHLYDCAAYQLDRMLGMNHVPPSVPRNVGNRDGTVTLWIEHTIMDVDRRERGLEPPSTVRWHQQQKMMYVFDALVGNADSNLSNVLIDRTWKLWFIDHTRSFVTSKKLFAPKSLVHCERGLWSAVNELDKAGVKERLGPYLDGKQIDAVMGRRDEVVKIIQQEINARGEEAVLYDLQPPGDECGDW
jgi:hypothetical protein